MNVGIISSRAYLPMARIMLKSLLSTTDSNVELYLFHIDLQEDDFNYLALNKEKMNIHPILVDASCFEGIEVKGHYGLFSYFRLLAPYILPKEIKRILWLDTDLIIQKDLENYYNSDFNGNALIASPSVMNILGKGLPPELKKKYNVGESTYFNAGVLLLDLDYIRKSVSLDLMLTIAHEDKELLKYIDQDVLNILFWDKVQISSQYLYNFSPKDAFYDKNINSKTIKDAFILHYCGAKKPTDFTYPDIGFEEYWSIAKIYNPYCYYKTKGMHKVYDILRKFKRLIIKR